MWQVTSVIGRHRDASLRTVRRRKVGLIKNRDVNVTELNSIRMEPRFGSAKIRMEPRFGFSGDVLHATSSGLARVVEKSSFQRFYAALWIRVLGCPNTAAWRMPYGSNL